MVYSHLLYIIIEQCCCSAKTRISILNTVLAAGLEIPPYEVRSVAEVKRTQSSQFACDDKAKILESTKQTTHPIAGPGPFRDKTRPEISIFRKWFVHICAPLLQGVTKNSSKVSHANQVPARLTPADTIGLKHTWLLKLEWVHTITYCQQFSLWICNT